MRVLAIADALPHIIERSHFPVIKDAQAEQFKIEVLRICIGLIAFYRTAQITYASLYYFQDPPAWGEWQISWQFGLGLCELFLLLLLIVGFFTPIVTMCLLLSYNLFDRLLLTETLGSSVLTLLLIGMLVTGSGRRLSIDCLTMHRFPNALITLALQRVYCVFRRPDKQQLATIYFIAFIAYGLVSFGAMTMHLADRNWTSGQTIRIIFTSSYLCRFYEAFRFVEAEAGWVLHWFSIFGGIGQSIFQFLMIPLIFTKWGTRFIVIWGLLFFAGSIACLQLSYLAPLEVAFWAFIFLRFKSESREQDSHVADALGIKSGVFRPAVAWVLLVFMLFAVHVVELHGHIKLPVPPSTTYYFFAHQGLQIPIVFNEADLKMSETWPVIRRHGPGDDDHLVPLNGPDGERLSYHASDLIYYGNSLRWRRYMQGTDVSELSNIHSYGYRLIQRVIQYDYWLSGLREPTKYTITIFQSLSTNTSEENLTTRYQSRPVYSFEIVEVGSSAGSEGTLRPKTVLYSLKKE